MKEGHESEKEEFRFELFDRYLLKSRKDRTPEIMNFERTKVKWINLTNGF